jgi:hypothetical protein
MTDPVTNPKPIEAKVTAATVGAGAGTVISTFLVWVLDEYVWKVDSVPDPVQGMVYFEPSIHTYN